MGYKALSTNVPVALNNSMLYAYGGVPPVMLEMSICQLFWFIGLLLAVHPVDCRIGFTVVVLEVVVVIDVVVEITW